MAKRSNKTRRDVCQEITDKVIESLEAGVAPWRKPFEDAGAADIPENAATGNAYNGVNILELWVSQFANGYTSGRWMTFNQAKAAGGIVRKGEKSTIGVIYKDIEKKTGEIDANGDPEKEHFKMLKGFPLFNLDQIDGIEHKREDYNRARYDFTPAEAGEQLIAAAGVTMNHGGGQAFYRPSTDEITLPEPDRFERSEDYYAVAVHELTHATKHRDRCDRKPYETKVKHGAYAFEELVAELGALFTLAHIGLPQPVTNHDSYIAGWLSVLKEDKKAIFRASAQAQQAADWMLSALASHDNAEAA